MNNKSIRDIQSKVDVPVAKKSLSAPERDSKASYH